MWTWLAVGSAAYLAFLACVIVVLRAAKARARAERAVDAREFGPSSPSPPAVERAGPDPDPAGPTTDDRQMEASAEDEAARAHPEPDDSGEPVRGCAPGPVVPPNPPASRMRG